MKLRNKQTPNILGKIAFVSGENGSIAVKTDQGVIWYYNSLDKLNEEWEDVPEEPKEDGLDHIITLVEAYSNHDSERYPKEIVEKLKAWKRLKDKGFKFKTWHNDAAMSLGDFIIFAEVKDLTDIIDDMNLLFQSGGEE